MFLFSWSWSIWNRKQHPEPSFGTSPSLQPSKPHGFTMRWFKVCLGAVATWLTSCHFAGPGGWVGVVAGRMAKDAQQFTQHLLHVDYVVVNGWCSEHLALYWAEFWNDLNLLLCRALFPCFFPCFFDIVSEQFCSCRLDGQVVASSDALSPEW